MALSARGADVLPRAKLRDAESINAQNAAGSSVQPQIQQFGAASKRAWLAETILNGVNLMPQAKRLPFLQFTMLYPTLSP